jgi:hypothetical protein
MATLVRYLGHDLEYVGVLALRIGRTLSTGSVWPRDDMVLD